MLVIPVNPVNAQLLTVTLANQPTQLVITQRPAGIFVDIYVNSALLLAGCIARNAVPMIQDLYFGYEGDLAFYDTQATTATNGLDPYYTGLGDRFILVYLTPADLGGAG
jgi:hypothetical protein